MNKKAIIFLLGIWLVSCVPAFPIPTPVLVTPQELVPPFLPTMTPTFTPVGTAFISPTNTATIEPTETPVPLDTTIPIPPGLDGVQEGFLSYTGVDSIFFMNETAQVEDLQAFYMTELVNDGWEWVYTDVGISHIPAPQTHLLILEFRKEGNKLGVLVYGSEEGGLLGFAAIGYSGYYQFFTLLAGAGDSASISNPSKEDVQPASMQFSSPYITFQHPSSWLAQDQLMMTFTADDNTVYLLQETSGPCNAMFDPCFVVFSDWSGSHYEVPVSIRIHADMNGLSLEQADALRWQQLNAPSNPYVFPEDVAEAGTLQTTETRTFTLADGTPAIQRTFQWKQLKLDQVIMGSYVLFLSEGGYVEFHTDYTAAEWETMKPLIEQVVAGMKSKP